MQLSFKNWLNLENTGTAGGTNVVGGGQTMNPGAVTKAFGAAIGKGILNPNDMAKIIQPIIDAANKKNQEQTLAGVQALLKQQQEDANKTNNKPNTTQPQPNTNTNTNPNTKQPVNPLTKQPQQPMGNR